MSGQTFTFDAENRIATANGGAPSGASYSYDGDGRRIKKVTGLITTVYVYNMSGQMVAEYSDAQADGSGDTSYLTADTLGTPRVITDSSGGVKARHDYAPFGEEIAYNMGGRSDSQKYVYGFGGDGEKHKFTGKERDSESGLDYFGARYYSSINGRFTSPDPLFASGKSFQPQSWNRYTYCINKKLILVDPNGLIWGYRVINMDGGKAKIGLAWFDGKINDKRYQAYHGPNVLTLADGRTVSLGRGTYNVLDAKPRLVESNAGLRNAGIGALHGTPIPFVEKITEAAGIHPDEDSSEYQAWKKGSFAVGIALNVASAGVASGATRAAEPLAEEGTTLFRAVSHAEFEQVMRTGTFEAGPNSLGGKFFAETVEHAEQWGQLLEGKAGFRIVDAKIPTAQAEQFMRWESLDGIGPARYAELHELKNAVIGTVK